MRTIVTLMLTLICIPAFAQETREPAGVTPPSFTAPHAEVSPAASPFQFSGFANFGYAAQTSGFNIQETDARSISGFNLGDAAFYANYQKDRVSIYLDLGARRQFDKDVNPAAGSKNQSSTNNVGIGVDRSQFYLKYKLNGNWAFDAGQFDTIFGVELNDAKDRFFNKTGLVYEAMMPVTHAGAMIEFSQDGLYAKAFAANPNNQGSYGNSASSGTNTEYGATVGYAGDFWHAQLGYMIRPVRVAAGDAQDLRSLGDAVIGAALGDFTFDVEFAMVKDPTKNTLTAATDEEPPGTGIFALLTYKLNEKLSFGARFESLNNDPAGNGNKSSKAEGLGLHYRLAPELELRTELLDAQTKTLTGDFDGRRFELSVLASF